MLIKSRATGRESLKMQDRIYFECLVDDGVLRKDYRFFSPQDTFAKIASSFTTKARNTEILVKQSGMRTTYRRLPVVMRLYEAISQGFLTDQVDTMIIRCFDDNLGPELARACNPGSVAGSVRRSGHAIPGIWPRIACRGIF